MPLFYSVLVQFCILPVFLCPFLDAVGYGDNVTLLNQTLSGLKHILQIVSECDK